MSRDAGTKLAALVARCANDPATIGEVRSEGDRLAVEAGGQIAFDWRVAVLRALIAAPPDDDAVREHYGELCDRYRDEPQQLAVLKTIGEEIRRLESEGTLPSTLVARSDRRRRP